ncbi:hypothetical protein B0H16DRAFT_1887039 [Mycena metata]|uniref:Dirigent protein n=1 Tax=Mycena metata TaxID=1033252 RepID=A0AAD7N9V4_9AGAR|nr:hypothetical protein B0H16DRAFT_1887039 [Mycena metata]
MGPSPPFRHCLALTLFLTLTHATVTVYTPTQVVFTTAPAVSGTPAAYTGVAAYNPGTLSPPPLPSPTVLTNPNPVNLLNTGTPGLGVKQKGSFWGSSIEMSVTNQRADSVMVRVGEFAGERAYGRHRRDPQRAAGCSSTLHIPKACVYLCAPGG